MLAVLVTGCGSLPPNTERAVSHALPAAPGTVLGRLASQARREARGRQDSGFAVLDSADSAYSSRLALTEQASRSLDLQYYAIHEDPSTRTLLRAIRAAAARGVRVRILLDDFNSKGTDALVLRLAFVPNVEMRLFNPLPGGRSLGALRGVVALQDFRRMQHRMHNKLFIADNAVGIVGGRNLGETYFGQGTDSNFIDLDMMVTGRLVQQMSASFDEYWNHPLAYPVQRLIARADLQAFRPPVTPGIAQPLGPDSEADHGPSTAEAPPGDLPAAMPLQDVQWIWAPSSLLSDRPAKLLAESEDESATDTVVGGLQELMKQARRRVLIVSPYFVPGRVMMGVFADLRRRGVQVQVLTNSLASTDAAAAHIGYARHREALLRLGVELYEMRALQRQSARTAFGSSGKASRASLHAKLLVLDDQIISIGSMNIDLRSRLQNTEIGLLIRSRKLAAAVTSRVEPVMRLDAWQVRLSSQNQLQWLPPQGSAETARQQEPDASATLRLLLKLVAPFAPDELL